MHSIRIPYEVVILLAVVIISTCGNSVEAGGSSSITNGNFFTRMRDSTGLAMCLSDPPDQVLMCSSKPYCSLVVQSICGCVAFNWLQHSRSCELYFWNATNYSLKGGCTAFKKGMQYQVVWSVYYNCVKVELIFFCNYSVNSRK